MPVGYAGRVLRVDLTDGRVAVEEPGEKFYRMLLGGKGFAGHYLLEEVPAGADPLGPENVLVLAGSVVSGLPIPGYSRFTVAARSPLTGGYGEAEAGGYLAPELKFAGFEAVVVTGASDRPVYLFVHDGQAEIRDASRLWGLGTFATERTIREELGDARVRVASIGPAGENLVRYACVMHEGRNAAGRCGLGAVMGSKRLKAVAVRGTGRPELADREGVLGIARWFRDHYRDNPLTRALHDLGTAGLLGGLNASGVLPTRNFSAGSFEGWEALSGEAYEKRFVVDRWGCYACPVRCKRTVRLDGAEVGGPEYETIAAFGSNLGSDDLASIVEVNRLCNDLGLDTISTGVTLALAAECYERGLITASDTGGVQLRFGRVPAQELVRLIARREGFGADLAEGVRRLAEKIGGTASSLAVEVKGLEAAMHDPRGKVSVGLGYALAAHGADHMVAAHDTMFLKRGVYALDRIAPFGLLDPVDARDLGAAKVRHFATLEVWWDTLKSLGICFFCVAPRSLLPVGVVVDSVRYATGWETSLYELMQAGERANVQARLFNCREGLGAADDRLPARFAEDAAGGHPGIDQAAFAQARRTYYELRGWDAATGRPRAATLNRLGLPVPGWLP
ncbi:MAG: aldehyde ferredoxin oxidoreductase family protein [Bacillota bacterium]|nr:aldehyde ferredoxin oxidoreductase family protein [Bacillota bacterium]